MDLVLAKWTSLEEKFIHNATRAYRGIQKTLISVSEDSSYIRELFTEIDRIMADRGEFGVRSHFAEEDMLIRHLPQMYYSDDEAGLEWGIRDWLMGKTLKKLLKHHLDGLRYIKNLNKTIAKEVGHLADTPPQFYQQSTDIVMCMLGELSDLVNIQIVAMACVDMKLGSLQRGSSTKMTLIKKIVYSLTKVLKSFYNQSEDAETEGFAPKQLKCNTTSSRSPANIQGDLEVKWGRGGKAELPSSQTVHVTCDTSADDISQLDLDVSSVGNSQTPDSGVVGRIPRTAWIGGNQNETPNCESLSEKSNVFVCVTKAYKPQNKSELNLKIGQVVKQESAADEDGMAFGWTRTCRFAFKKRGFYPVNCVELKTSKPVNDDRQ